MPNVRMPNGDVVAFPDDMPREQVRSLIEKKFKPQQESGLGQDIVNTAKSAAYSVPFGFGDEIRDAAAAVTAGTLSPDLTIKDAYKQAREQSLAEQQQMREQTPVGTFAGDIAGSVLTGAGLAKTGIANSIRGGNALSRIVKGTAAGAASGSAYGAGTAAGDDRTRGSIHGGILGGVVGAAAPAIATAASGLKSTVLPKIEQETAKLAQRAKDFGIDLRLDQISPTRARSTVQKVSQEIPFSGVDAQEATARAQWNRSLSKTIGQDSENLGPETINKFLEDAGKKFSSAVGDTEIAFGPKDLNTFGDIISEARQNLTRDVAKVVENNVKKFLADSQFKFGTGRMINSQKLASLRSDIIRNLPKVQGDARPLVSEIVDKIDDVVQREIGDAAAGTLKQARREWRNYRTIEPLLEKSTDGTINPTDLMNKVASSKYIKASRSELGKDDIVDLARIGKQFLVKKGGSDTAQKVAVMSLVRNPLSQLGLAALSPLNIGLQKANTSSRLVNLAIENAGKTAKKTLARPKSTVLLEGAIAGRTK